MVGSGASEKSSQCLLLLDKSLFPAASVRHVSVYQGRLLHVRAELQGEVWEFLNVYQKVLPHGGLGVPR